MSILATFFRFFPRTRGEEQIVHFSVPCSTGTPGTVTGNSSFVTSVTASSTGVYAVVLSRGFPAFLGGNVLVELTSAPTKGTTAVIKSMNAAAGTFTVYVTQDDALYALAGTMHFTLFFAANTAPYA